MQVLDKSSSKCFLGVILCMLLNLFCFNAIAQEFVIFSLNDQAKPISISKAKMIYQGKARKIKGVKKLSLVDWPDDSLVKSDFYRTLLGKSVSQVNGYWASIAFSGKGSKPNEVKRDDINDILTWLNENPNGIAYAPKSLVPASANILFSISKGG